MTVLSRHVFTTYKRKVYSHDLPQSFQDAIATARILGLQYLWIDALCIIQDDVEDWRHEAANMGNYYRDAFVVLSSLSASDGRLGFLRPRDQRSGVHLGGGLRLRYARPIWHDIFRQSPLSTRAWPLQERLLATRIIHFEQGELLWECLTCSARESGFDLNTEQWQGMDWTDESFKRSLGMDALVTTGAIHHEDMIMQQWYRVLSQYSALQLTRKADIFPAIAGIAQRISEMSRFTYVAGLWREHINSGLLWYSDTAYARQTDSWLAPTWSWASLGAAIKMMYGRHSRPIHSEYEAQLVDIRASPSGDNPFGEISSASMTLDAVHFEVRCISSSAGEVEYGSAYLHMVLDVFNESGAFIGTGYWDRIPEQTEKSCTAIIVGQRQDRHFSETAVTYFLLAERHETFFRRIGIGQTADIVYGYVTSTLDLASCDRSQFVMI